MPSILKEPRKTIAVNLDETLSHTLDAMLAWHNTYQKPSTDLHTVARYWNDDEYSGKIRSFYQSDHFDMIQPTNDFALEALKMLKKRGFHLVIITSRQQFIAEETKTFVDKHYNGIFESIYFCNLGLTGEEQQHYISKRKSTICQEIGVDVLIDHQLEHCMDCANIGVDVLLYDPIGQQQQQQQRHLGGGKIKRVTTWREIIHHHFPKPNSPLRHLVYSYSQSPPLEMDNDEDDYDYDYQMDQDGNEIILLEQGDSDEDDSDWI